MGTEAETGRDFAEEMASLQLRSALSRDDLYLPAIRGHRTHEGRKGDRMPKHYDARDQWQPHRSVK